MGCQVGPRFGLDIGIEYGITESVESLSVTCFLTFAISAWKYSERGKETSLL
jgi:hypothetical protein